MADKKRPQIETHTIGDIPELLKMTDEGKIAMSPVVELSYLSEEHQKILLDAMQEHDCTPSYSQAVKLKALSKEDKLDMQKS